MMVLFSCENSMEVIREITKEDTLPLFQPMMLFTKEVIQDTSSIA